MNEFSKQKSFGPSFPDLKYIKIDPATLFWSVFVAGIHVHKKKPAVAGFF